MGFEHVWVFLLNMFILFQVTQAVLFGGESTSFNLIKFTNIGQFAHVILTAVALYIILNDVL